MLWIFHGRMQQVLSHGLWKEVCALSKKAQSVRAAIAYVTASELLKFQKGDLLIVNASEGAIRGGQTSAKVLSALHKRGVEVYNCSNLHAKVLLIDNVAVIGSGNMSQASAGGLVKAALRTGHRATVSGVQTFLRQLVEQSERLTAKRLVELRKIKVIRAGNAPWGLKR